MLPPDSDITRQLARERQARLKQAWQWANPAQPDLVETRRRQLSFRFAWLLTHLRPAGSAARLRSTRG
jgi:hypothetical protein